MKPAAFEYEMVDTVEAALAALARGGDEAKVIAGGQSLVPMLNFRLLRPSLLVDINRIGALSFLEMLPDAIRVGALTRHRTLETDPAVARDLPVLSAAMRHVAHLAIRNRGTLGGSLSHADPAAELPMLALLLDGVLTIAGPDGTRQVPAAEFFLGTMYTALAEDELLTAVTFPKLPPGTGWDVQEVARRAGDFALVALAATLTVGDGAITEARIALMGVGETPVRATEAEAVLTGHAMSEDLAAEAGELVRRAIEPQSDLHASGDYRRHLAGVLSRRALANAWARAVEGAV